MKNLIQAAVVTLVAASAAQAQQAVQWRVEDGGNGHWYALRWYPDSGRTFAQAQADAVSVGAHLATATSSAENEWMKANVVVPNPSGTIWAPSMGGRKVNGAWTWITGEPWSFTAWGSAEPTGDGPNLQYWRYGALHWNDHPDGNDKWLTEWSADCNNDGIVDYGQIASGALEDSDGDNVPDCCETGNDCSKFSKYAMFTRPTDTVQIGSNTSLSGDYTLEWSGFLLDQPVATNPPATWNARIWSEQNSVTEDKAMALNPDRTPAGWVNSACSSGISGPSPIPVRKRTHVALVRSGSIRRLFVDGAVVATSSEPCEPFSGGGSNMALGAFVYVAQSPENFWRAAPVALDWIRVSSSARYSGDFFPPAEAGLVVDAQTQLLMNFEGADPWRDLANPQAVSTPGAGVAGGTAPTVSADCNMNGTPDLTELVLPGADQDGNGILDACESPTCRDADLFPDGRVGGDDLGILLVYWGPVTTSAASRRSDINRDGFVNGDDLGFLLTQWGPCAN